MIVAVLWLWPGRGELGQGVHCTRDNGRGTLCEGGARVSKETRMLELAEAQLRGMMMGVSRAERERETREMDRDDLYQRARQQAQVLPQGVRVRVRTKGRGRDAVAKAGKREEDAFEESESKVGRKVEGGERGGGRK